MRAPARNERGSMFIMVLLILLILTSVALSLVFVTEIEMQLGGTERVMSQTFYAAESGVHAALAGVQNQNWCDVTLAFPEKQLGANRQIGTRVLTTIPHTVGPPQLPPMTMANEGDIEFFTFAITLQSTAQRVSWPVSSTRGGSFSELPVYPEGDPREQQVTIQSQQTLDVRYLLSPVGRPASPRETYNAEDVCENSPRRRG